MVVTFKRGDLVFNTIDKEFGIVHRYTKRGSVLIADFEGFVDRIPPERVRRAIVNFAGIVVLWGRR